MKGYICLKLTEEDRRKNLTSVNPKFPEVVNHHITHMFNVEKPESFDKNARVEVIGLCRGCDIDCLVVSVDGKTHAPDGRRYHITYSREEGVEAYKSNEILDNYKIENIKSYELKPIWAFIELSEA